MKIKYETELNENELVEMIGLEAVEFLDNENCDFSMSHRDDGLVMFDSRIEIDNPNRNDENDYDKITVKAIYFQTEESVASEGLDSLDWVEDHYIISGSY